AEPARHAEDAADQADVLAHDEDAPVALHLAAERLVEGLGHRDLAPGPRRRLADLGVGRVHGRFHQLHGGLGARLRELDRAVESAYWLFSQRKMIGSAHTAARFSASWTTPWLAPPSPKKAMTTLSVFLSFDASAAPVPMGTPAATIPLQPRMFRSSAAMCIEPPRPRQ